MFEMGQASVAATLACQSRLYDELTGDSDGGSSVRPSRTSWFNPSGSLPLAAQATSPAQRWLALSATIPLWPGFTSDWGNDTCDAAAWWGTAWMAALSDWQAGPQPTAAFAFWGVSPWNVYQGPMIATMLSYGVPYAVAAPTARASTSALDAADAVRAQWNCIFGDSSGESRQDKSRRARCTT